MKQARRRFLKQAGIGGAALTVAGCAVDTRMEHGHQHDAEHARVHSEHMAAM